MTNSIQEINIGFYELYYSSHSISISASKELQSIKNGTHSRLVNEARFSFDRDRVQYGALKRQLPGVTFSGVFQGLRKTNHLTDYSNLIVLDIDNLEKSSLEEKKKYLFDDPYTFAAWKSPSGQGLKLLIKVSTDKAFHKTAFDLLISYYQNKYDVEFDVSGSDITRLCFSSFDENLLMKDGFTAFNVLEQPGFRLLESITPEDPGSSILTGPRDMKILNGLMYDELGRNKKDDKETMAKIIRYLKSKKLSITASYDAWFRVALAISNTFTFDVGLRYFLALSRLDGIDHDEQRSFNILEYCYRNRRVGAINFSTIIYFALQKGFKLSNAKS